MFDAQILINGSTTTTVLGPWMPRGGDNGRFTLDLINASLTGSGKLKVTLQTKAVEDAGDGSELTGMGDFAIEQSSPARYTEEQDGGLKDLVRYRFTFTNASSGDWVLFRMLPPSWFDAVDTTA